MPDKDLNQGRGRVYFIGAGPGDPELITVKGQRILREADVIVYTDSLVSPEILRWARPDAEVYGSAGLTLEEIMAVLVESAREGKTVARVHTGDPAIYGAVLEQYVILNREGIPYQVVPGVSSAFGAAAALGVEMTVPELAQTVILSRMEGRTPVPEGEKLRDLAAHGTTLVLYLSAALMEKTMAELLAGGYPAGTPVAVVQRATWPDQVIVRGTLADIAQKTRAAGIRKHALIMVGQVFDPELPLRGGEYRSKLYDKDFGHMYRRADWVKARDEARAKVAATAAPVAAGVSPAVAQGEEKLALVAITRHSVALGARLQDSLPGADLLVPAKFADLAPAGAIPFQGSPSRIMGDLFARYDGIVFFVSLGAVVRMIAPHVKDKHSDPGVVVVDDRGQFAIPVLSGHVGGANDLARQVSQALGAQAVVTTASDVHGTIGVDVLGREFGWQIDGWDHVTAASAAVVNGDPVAIYQDAGEAGWWRHPGPLPKNLHLVSSLEACAGHSAALVITDRAQQPEDPPVVVVYRPRTLVVGVGCNRGTSAAEITQVVALTLAEFGLAPASVGGWASIDAKADEVGLLQAVENLGLKIQFYSKDELNAIDVPNPSEAALRYVGAKGVAEPAALLAAGTGAKLVVPKQKCGNCTVAVARICSSRGR